MLKKLPVGIQDFKKLREENCIYVDKTKILYKLITEGSYYFLSRPRRFGKSLTISTLNEIYEGNQELFEGLFIYDKIEWKKRPVIRVDFSTSGYKKIGLEQALENILTRHAEKYGVELTGMGARERFGELVRKLCDTSGNKVALLIDEYDKPIIDYLTDVEKAEENREILRDFYGVIKPLDPYTEFVILTGVSKFSKVSIFSELNNLEDITTSSRYSTIVGLTKEEIDTAFPEYASHVMEKLDLSKEEYDKELKQWYDGYSWDVEKEVYNPFSVLNMLKNESFSNYWFATGTPTFLVDFIKKHGIKAENFENIKVDSLFFDKFDLVNLDIKSLMFQTGYLTIKKRDKRGFYHLSYPNKEVRDSFSGHLLSAYSEKPISNIGEITSNLLDALEENNMEDFQDNINALFSSIPHQIFLEKVEAYYHSIVYLILKMIGIYIDAEVSTNKGRIDAVIKTDDYLYVMEFKMLPDTSKDAVNQIREKGYARPYAGDSRTKFMVGISFDADTKRFEDFLTEKF